MDYSTPTIRRNLERVLAHLGLAGAVSITREESDRCWGWPTPALREYVTSHGWMRDPAAIVAAQHGGGESFRETDGCHPAMQIVFHSCAAGEFVELDLDQSAPVDVVGMVWHGVEVLENAVKHRTTDQAAIARMLDRRFGDDR